VAGGDGEWQWGGGSGMSRQRRSVRFEWCVLEHVSVDIERVMVVIVAVAKMAGGRWQWKNDDIENDQGVTVDGWQWDE
jgi:hypothetical protein